MLYRSVILPYIKLLQEFPEEPMLQIGDDLVTNALFAKRVASIVNELEALPDTTIGLLVEDSIDTFAAAVAALIAGKTLLPVRASWTAEQRAAVQEMAGVQTVLTAARMHYYYYMTFENALDRLDAGMDNSEGDACVALLADFQNGKLEMRKVTASEICPNRPCKKSGKMKTIQPGTPLGQYFTLLQLNNVLLSQQA